MTAKPTLRVKKLSYTLPISGPGAIEVYQDFGLIDPDRDPEDVWRELQGEARRDPETQSERDYAAINPRRRAVSNSRTRTRTGNGLSDRLAPARLDHDVPRR